MGRRRVREATAEGLLKLTEITLSDYVLSVPATGPVVDAKFRSHQVAGEAS